MSVYLDASVIVPLLVSERATVAVAALVGSGQELMVSDFALAEVASALSRSVRSNGLPVTVAQARLVDLDVWCSKSTTRVGLRATDVSHAAALVRRFELMLRAPDALHLVIAQRSAAALATLDVRLARAAEAIGLPLATISG